MRKEQVGKTYVDSILLDAVHKPRRTNDVYLTALLQRCHFHRSCTANQLLPSSHQGWWEGDILLSAMQVVLGAAVFVW